MGKEIIRKYALQNRDGIALILVLGILAVLVTLATTFAFNMRLEQKAARNYLDAVTADCIAKAGIQYAIALLNNDANGYDSYDEAWSTSFRDKDNPSNNQVDNDGVGGNDSQWIEIKDPGGNLRGAYAIYVVDEAGKININTAGNPSSEASGWSTFEVDIGDLAGLDSGDDDNIVHWRYGTSGTSVAGQGGASPDDDNDDSILIRDGIDNDSDGDIDETDEGINEPDEFVPDSIYDGSDNEDIPYLTPMQVKLAPDISNTNYSDVKHLITTYSKANNLYLESSTWKAPLNINAATADEIYGCLKNAGILTSDAERAQAAANIADYKDWNYLSSVVTIGAATHLYGADQLQINEVMSEAVIDIEPNDAEMLKSFSSTGAGADWTNGATANGNDGGDEGTWTWYFDNGRYDIYIDQTDGSNLQLEGLGAIDGWNTGVNVTGGDIELKITDAADATNATFARIRVKAGEYIEIINLGKESPSASWNNDVTIDATGADKWDINVNGTIYHIDDSDKTLYDMNGTTYDFLVVADSIYGVERACGKTVNGVWGDFGENGELTVIGTMDIPDTPTAGTDFIQLRDGDANVVCHVKNFGDSAQNISQERADPRLDIAGNWVSHASNGTPGDNNSNFGSNLTYTYPYIKNRSFATIGEMDDDTADVSGIFGGVNDGTAAWESGTISAANLAEIVDKITVTGIRLDPENADDDNMGVGNNWGLGTLYYTDDGCSTSTSDDEAWWKWTFAKIPEVSGWTYDLYFYGLKDGTVRIKFWDYGLGDWDADGYSTDIIPSYNDGVKSPDSLQGKHIDGNTGDKGAIKIKVKNTSGAIAYFDYIVLTRTPTTAGKININTAPSEVLKCLPGIGSADATNIIAGRPYDDNATTWGKLGIGELPGSLSKAQFSKIANLTTVRSDVFQIICTARAVKDIDGDGVYDVTVPAESGDDLILAEKKIEVIVDRSPLNLTGGAIKILSWKEIME